MGRKVKLDLSHYSQIHSLCLYMELQAPIIIKTFKLLEEIISEYFDDTGMAQTIRKKNSALLGHFPPNPQDNLQSP